MSRKFTRTERRVLAVLTVALAAGIALVAVQPCGRIGALLTAANVLAYFQLLPTSRAVVASAREAT